MASRMSSGTKPREPSTDSSRQKISAARTLNGSRAAPMSTTRPPGPPIAMACSSARASPTSWMTTSAPMATGQRPHRRHGVHIGCGDHLVRTQPKRQACFSAERVTAMTRAPNALPSCTALEPRPPTPRTTSVSPGISRAMRLRPWMGVATASVSTASTSGGTGAGGRTSAATGPDDVLREGAVEVHTHAPDTGLMLGRPAAAQGSSGGVVM